MVSYGEKYNCNMHHPALIGDIEITDDPDAMKSALQAMTVQSIRDTIVSW